MVGHGYAEGSNLHWDPSVPAGQCGGTVGGCVVSRPNLPPNLNGSLLTPEFAFLRDKGNTTWTTHENVWVVYNESADDSGLPSFPTPGPNGGYWHGALSVGYGGDHKGLDIDGRTNHTEVGPELGFGWTLGDALKVKGEQQVLLIKTAWGGKTIDIDFRPPSSAAANKTGPPVGPYYTWMVNEVKDTLSKLKTFFPTTYPGSYEIAGFVWHQGWNDACRAGGANPDNYEFDLANLIRDLRKDLKAPDMKAIVGTSGMCGFANTSKYPQNEGYQHCAGACATLDNLIIPAQLAVGNVTKYPEFAGNVASVELRSFHFDMEESSGNQCYHWNNNAKSYWLAGKAMADAFLQLEHVH